MRGDGSRFPNGDDDVKFSQSSDFSAFSIHHWEKVSPSSLDSRVVTPHSLAPFFCHWPPGNETWKREGGGGGFKLNFPPLLATGQMYFHYFIPGFRGSRGKAKAKEKARISMGSHLCLLVLSRLPFVPSPSPNPSEAAVATARDLSSNSFFTAFPTVTSLPSRPLAVV